MHEPHAKIRKINTTTGIIATVAGNGIVGSNGDGGQATQAQLKFPFGVCTDKLGNIFIADRDNHKIRKVSTTGIITTIVGSGTLGFSGDGFSALNAQLHYPSGVCVDTCGNLFIADKENKRVRKVSFNPNCFPLNINEKPPLTFTLSPNPATAHITITSSTQLKQLQLVNAVGVTVLRAEHESDKITLDLSDLPTGIYFLTVYDEQGNKRTEKIIKQ